MLVKLLAASLRASVLWLGLTRPVGLMPPILLLPDVPTHRQPLPHLAADPLR